MDEFHHFHLWHSALSSWPWLWGAAIAIFLGVWKQ